MSTNYGGGGVGSLDTQNRKYARANNLGQTVSPEASGFVLPAVRMDGHTVLGRSCALPASTLSGYVEALFAEQYAREQAADHPTDFSRSYTELTGGY